MNRKNHRAFAAQAARLPSLFDKYSLARQTVDKIAFDPLSPEQEAISAALVAVAMRKGRWFHGGGPGLQIGDTLLPARVTGRDPRRNGSSLAGRKDHVFITPHPLTAAHYAKISGGRSFEVLPLGRVDVEMADMHAWLLVSRIEPGLRGLWRSNPMAVAMAIFPAIQGYVCQSAQIVGEIEE